MDLRHAPERYGFIAERHTKANRAYQGDALREIGDAQGNRLGELSQFPGKIEIVRKTWKSKGF